MKQNIAIVLLLATLSFTYAQTNTFPTTGNVGIGTDNPQAKLEVLGDFKAIQGTFTTSLPNGTDYTYSQNLSINDAAVALSAGSIIGSGPGYVKTRMLNFFDFPSKTAGSNTGAIAFFNIVDRNDKDRFRFIGVAGLDGTAVMYNKSQQEVFKVYDNGSDKIVMTLPKLDSYLGIGTNNPQTKLDVAGNSSFRGNMKVDAKVEAKEVKVTTTPTADFVFAEDFKLLKLEEVEKHIKEKKHLPEIASAKEMEKNGVNIGEFQIKLLQKIEELTLYMIEQEKRIKTLERENGALKKE